MKTKKDEKSQKKNKESIERIFTNFSKSSLIFSLVGETFQNKKEKSFSNTSSSKQTVKSAEKHREPSKEEKIVI